MRANIAEDLESLAYPIEKLELLPGNPNRGDVKGVAKSLKQFKQRKPIVAKRDGDREIILAGNTTFLAARDELDWTHIAVSWADELDEANAAGFALADNELAKHGETDERALEEMQEVARQDTDVWDATGFDQELSDKIFADAIDELDPFADDEDDDEDLFPDPPEPPAERKTSPVIQYAIIFDDEDQQQRWYAFVRYLRKAYPDTDTIAERLDLFLGENVPEEDD